MSDMSIASAMQAPTPTESQISGSESAKESSSTIMSGVNPGGADSAEQIIAGESQASDNSVDLQKTVSLNLQEGTGSITNLSV